MDNKTPYDQENTAKEYEKYYETKYERADQLEKQLLKELFAHFSNAGTVLEVGCGTGHFSRWMESALLLKCVGLDSSKAMLEEAKERWPNGVFLQSDGCHLPLREKSVDLTVFVTSLEFIPDASMALKEAARVAKKGIILGLMNKNSVSALRKRFQAATQTTSFYRHAKFYSFSNINKLLGKALEEKYEIAFYNTTVFSKSLGNFESSALPFGAFLGVALKLGDT